jgi:hypothetical protein
VTVAGHSYGGAIIGQAAANGMKPDRMLFIEAAGFGHDNWSLGDFADPTVPVYSTTTETDWINHVQGLQADPSNAGITVHLGHGADPDQTDGVIRLATGRKIHDDPSSSLIGGTSGTDFSSHSEVLQSNRPGMNSSAIWRPPTSFLNYYGVFTGGKVMLHEPMADTYVDRGVNGWYETHSPFENPEYEPPTVQVQSRER